MCKDSSYLYISVGLFLTAYIYVGPFPTAYISTLANSRLPTYLRWLLPDHLHIYVGLVLALSTCVLVYFFIAIHESLYTSPPDPASKNSLSFVNQPQIIKISYSVCIQIRQVPLLIVILFSFSAMVTIQFSLDDIYPDSFPIMEITESENLDDAQLDEILEHMNTIVSKHHLNQRIDK